MKIWRLHRNLTPVPSQTDVCISLSPVPSRDLQFKMNKPLEKFHHAPIHPAALLIRKIGRASIENVSPYRLPVSKSARGADSSMINQITRAKRRIVISSGSTSGQYTLPPFNFSLILQTTLHQQCTVYRSKRERLDSICSASSPPAVLIIHAHLYARHPCFRYTRAVSRGCRRMPRIEEYT